MGFGILTIGYYVTYLLGMVWVTGEEGSVVLWAALLVLLGCVMIATALLRLSEYERSFRNALFFSVILILPAVYRILFWLFSEYLLMETAFFSDYVWNVVQITEFLLFVAFQVTMLLAIRRLATDVEDEKIAGASMRNLVLLGFFAAVRLIAALPFTWAGNFAAPAVLVQVVCHLFVGIMLGSCYMRICDEGDVDMPLKKSRFAWVNRFREERARREQRAADSVTEYAENKLRKQKAERERLLAERKESRKKGNGKRR